MRVQYNANEQVGGAHRGAHSGGGNGHSRWWMCLAGNPEPRHGQVRAVCAAHDSASGQGPTARLVATSRGQHPPRRRTQRPRAQPPPYHSIEPRVTWACAAANAEKVFDTSLGVGFKQAGAVASTACQPHNEIDTAANTIMITLASSTHALAHASPACSPTPAHGAGCPMAFPGKGAATSVVPAVFGPAAVPTARRR